MKDSRSLKSKSLIQSINSIMVIIVIVLALIIAYFLYHNVFGNPANFIGGDSANTPKKDNILGIIYKGGPVVILLLAFQIILITFVIERFINVFRSSGRVNKLPFIKNIQEFVDQRKFDDALTLCKKNPSALSYVLQSGIHTFQVVEYDEDYENSNRLNAVERAFESATQLEIPPLNRNMVIISTIASISTLIGLLGTVTGMIKAFSAMAQVGAPDAVGLAEGISQALVTTALGISTAAVGVVFFNFFTNKIDKTINTVDEVVFAVTQSFKNQLAPAND
jgi:biopolymer transport protein ExbB